jgi:hypothetical protein
VHTPQSTFDSSPFQARVVYGFLRKIFHFAAIFSALKSLLETVVEALQFQRLKAI